MKLTLQSRSRGMRYTDAVTPQGLIGVVHLAPMPGDPRYVDGGFDGVYRRAMNDATALADGGACAIIVENFGSVPFDKGTGSDRLGPHVVALMTRVVDACTRTFELPVGVNCLRNDASSAVGIAAATGADFVRVNVHTGAMLTDQGIIEGEAGTTLRYRRALGADHVGLLADVLVKHAQPLTPTDAGAAAQDCVHRGLADGLIVTGRATGAATDARQLEQVRAAAPHTPLYVGSGLTPDNAAELCPLIHGAIVGTWLKQDGDVRAPVDKARVQRLAAFFAPVTRP